MLPEINRVDLVRNTFHNDFFDKTNWFMPVLQMAIALAFLTFLVVGKLCDRMMRSKVQQLERERFVKRGDVTGEYGRSTYGRTFEKLVWSCMRRRNTAKRVGIIERRDTLCDWLKATCRDFRTKEYWKTKFGELLEISRAEHTILGLIWPVQDELVYFTRTQRLISYYCGMMVSVWFIALGGGHMRTHIDGYFCKPAYPQKYSLRSPWWRCTFAPTRPVRRGGRALLR